MFSLLNRLIGWASRTTYPGKWIRLGHALINLVCWLISRLYVGHWSLMQHFQVDTEPDRSSGEISANLMPHASNLTNSLQRQVQARHQLLADLFLKSHKNRVA
jgi:hypothetical protein